MTSSSGASKTKRTVHLDLDSPELYLNRELTWVDFNWRVLHQVEDERVPLLERVKFLAIVGSNLDEFYMKRIGGLKQQIGAGMREPTVDGRTPEQQLSECQQKIRRMVERKQKLFAELRGALRLCGVELAEFRELSAAQKKTVRDLYFRNIFPLVTPQAMDPAHPFPFISNLSLNLLVTLHYLKDTTPLLARVKVPVGAGIPRFLQVGQDLVFVRLEDVVAQNLDLLFPGMEIDGCELFRVTRNANTARDEEQADDLLALIESELRERKFAPIVRLEVAKGMSAFHRGMLAAELGLDENNDVLEVDGMLGTVDLWEIAQLSIHELRDSAHHPVDNPELLGERSIFHTLRELGSVLVHHPYESFSTSVERFLKEASTDPKVLAIKITLYRTSEDSKVIHHLIDAARNGKQVAVVVELKARFDEGANIQWANRLEEYGIHVSYGVVGLKTHCKVILVLRRDYNGLRRYAHIGTGNYHAGTARTYSDLGLFTSDDVLGQDLTELFNYLSTGYKPKRNYQKLLIAPTAMKVALLEKIKREAKNREKGLPAHIRMKVNALEDIDVTRALYAASHAGVPCELLVRDTCRLRPGVPGLSENVCVTSIVGRFLEHARIFYFENGGTPEYYIGSADLMQRNLENRVECLVPVENPRFQQDLKFILDTQLWDRRSAWRMQTDGSYVPCAPEKGKDEVSSQQLLIEWAEGRHREATRLRKRKPKGIARRNVRI